MPLRAHTAGLAASLLLVLAACSEDTDPAADPPAKPAPSSVSTTPSPAIGDLASAPPNETAEQFIRRFFELMDFSQSTGEVAALLTISGPDCDSCRGFASTVREVYATGGGIKGGESKVISLRSEGGTQWIVTYEVAPSRVIRPGAETEALPGGRLKSRLLLAKADGRWLVGATEGIE